LWRDSENVRSRNQPREKQIIVQSFNVPPNWPAPPQGWTPPPGWEPDPAWPTAPQGWQFWTTPRKSAPGWLIVAALLATALGVVIFAAAMHSQIRNSNLQHDRLRTCLANSDLSGACN
jgi:hypothetical protein